MTSPTDASPPADDSGITAEQHTNRRPQPSRLNQALAWVGIAAGGLFIVAAIFFSGFFLSWTIGGHDEYMRPQAMACCDKMKSEDMKPGAMMGSGGHMKPGEMMPGGMMRPAHSRPRPQPSGISNYDGAVPKWLPSRRAWHVPKGGTVSMLDGKVGTLGCGNHPGDRRLGAWLI